MVSLAEVKSYLDIATGETSFDTVLAAFIESATGLINNILGYNLAQTTYDYFFEGNGKNEIFLPIYQISTATNLTEYVSPGDAGALIDFELFKISNLYYLYYISNFNYRYKVTITAGYTAIPSEIKHKCKELIAYYFRESGLSSGRMTGLAGVDTVSEQIQGMTTTYKFKSMFTDIDNYLAKYKMVAI